jgi:hypothetical protein
MPGRLRPVIAAYDGVNVDSVPSHFGERVTAKKSKGPKSCNNLGPSLSDPPILRNGADSHKCFGNNASRFVHALVPRKIVRYSSAATVRRPGLRSHRRMRRTSVPQMWETPAVSDLTTLWTPLFNPVMKLGIVVVKDAHLISIESQFKSHAASRPGRMKMRNAGIRMARTSQRPYILTT